MPTTAAAAAAAPTTSEARQKISPPRSASPPPPPPPPATIAVGDILALADCLAATGFSERGVAWALVSTGVPPPQAAAASDGRPDKARPVTRSLK